MHMYIHSVSVIVMVFAYVDMFVLSVLFCVVWFVVVGVVCVASVCVCMFIVCVGVVVIVVSY